MQSVEGWTQVRCWGANDLGQLGLGNIQNVGSYELPVRAPVLELGTVPIAQIGCGRDHACVVYIDGTVRCWGNNAYGDLGTGNTASIGATNVPVDTPTLGLGPNPVLNISMGYYTTCARYLNESVLCWGDGQSGLLGRGDNSSTNIGDTEVPGGFSTIDLGGPVLDIQVVYASTCALMGGNLTGAVRCFGENDLGQLGYGNTDIVGQAAPPAVAGDVPVGGGGSPVVQLAVGGYHVCVLLQDANVRCWGDNSQGQLGLGTNQSGIGAVSPASSAPNLEMGGNVVGIASGFYHTCALFDVGQMKCWGDASFGQLGYGNTEDIGDNETPADVGFVQVSYDSNVTVIEISAGGYHTCAQLSNFQVHCWGSNIYGELGLGIFGPKQGKSPYSTEVPAAMPAVNIFCGDGITVTQDGEQCDDGNALDGDGCSSVCSIEYGYRCDSQVVPSVCVLLRSLQADTSISPNFQAPLGSESALVADAEAQEVIIMRFNLTYLGPTHDKRQRVMLQMFCTHLAPKTKLKISRSTAPEAFTFDQETLTWFNGGRAVATQLNNELEVPMKLSTLERGYFHYDISSLVNSAMNSKQENVTIVISVGSGYLSCDSMEFSPHEDDTWPQIYWHSQPHSKKSETDLFAWIVIAAIVLVLCCCACISAVSFCVCWYRSSKFRGAVKDLANRLCQDRVRTT